MQTVTVAVADVDRNRRATYERFLHGEDGITLLSNVGQNNAVRNDHAFSCRRQTQRTFASASENEVARIKRLNPKVVLINLDKATDEEQALFLSLRCVCPESRIVLLAADAVSEATIIQAFEIGAQGYLKNETVELHLLRAVQVVGRGESWVPSKILGSIMDRLLN
jgi:DNA-binding NarL/FixJ family response regulator